MRNAYLRNKNGSLDTIPAYEISEYIPKFSRSKQKCKHKKGKSYFVNFATFDIEATTIPGDPPEGFMYHWQMNIAGTNVYGRSWEEWLELMEKLERYLGADPEHLFVIYIHNAGYEFQFIKDFLDSAMGGYKMFAAQKRKPIRFTCSNGFEFRCSYKLTNMSLQKFTENELGVQHPKMAGDLEYRKIRYPWTPLDDTEFSYCIGDVQSLYEAIKARLINEHDTLESIPYTSTGYVRRDCRRAARKADHYRDRVFKKNLLDVKIYTMLREAGRGGDTHANRYLAGRICEDCDSWDAVSDYPFQMLARLFPMRKFVYYGELDDLEELEGLAKDNACLFHVLFEGLQIRHTATMPYIAYSKCLKINSGATKDNGRVLTTWDGEDPGYAYMCINELDWEIIKDQYSWKEIYISDLYIAKKDLLPECIRDTVRDYYYQKSELKDKIKNCKDPEELDNLQYLYAKSKNRLNAIFGMCYTNPVHEEITCVGGSWDVKPPDIAKELEKYNTSRNSFLVYSWGVWVTSWARYHLWEFTKAAGEETQAYRDTDSAKGFDFDEEAIEQFNQRIIALAKDRGAYVTVNGKEYFMGYFEKENDKPLAQFVTLGAKKYCYLDNGHLHVTVSGVSTRKEHPEDPESIAARELQDIHNFKPGFKFREAGGVTLWYNDSSIRTVTYEGQSFTTSSNVGMLDSEYTIGITEEYADLIDWVDFE